MISFFDNGLYVEGADYGYTPEHTEARKRIENQKKIVTDEETLEETVVFEDVEVETFVVVPATGREDCIHVEYQEIPPGHTAVLTKGKKGYEVEFVPVETQTEAPPSTLNSDN